MSPAKKSVIAGEYILSVLNNGSIEVCRSSDNVKIDNVKEALRQIAKQEGFEYDPNWNTRQFGSKLIDFLNGNVSSKTKSTATENNEADDDNVNRDKLKQYVSNLQYHFDEFDMEDFDGSYYTNEGVVGEWFNEEQIDEAIDNVAWGNSDNKIIWLIDESYKYPAEVEDQVFNCIFSELSLNLDQGSIKLLEFKDGDQVLYTESNDAPYND